MTFGRHAGKELTTLPDSYLRWLLRCCDSATPALVHAAKMELASRGERYLDAKVVLDDVEDTLLELLTEDWQFEPDIASVVGDMMLAAFEQVRNRHRIGTQTQLVVPARKQSDRDQDQDFWTALKGVEG